MYLWHCFKKVPTFFLWFIFQPQCFMGKSTEIDYNMMFELCCLDSRKKSVNQEKSQSVWVLLFLIGVIYPIIKSFLPIIIFSTWAWKLKIKSKKTNVGNKYSHIWIRIYWACQIANHVCNNIDMLISSYYENDKPGGQ